MLMMLQYQSNPLLAAGVPTPRSSIYIDQMMGLYNKYFYEEVINQLLAKEIDTLNKKIGEILNNKENHVHLLLCETDFKQALTNIPIARQKGDFLLSGLSMIYKVTRDHKLKTLLRTSIDVIQQLNIKLIEFEEICTDLHNFKGVVDENSDDYKNKMDEIAEFIISSKKTKSGNSIRELLNV